MMAATSPANNIVDGVAVIGISWPENSSIRKRAGANRLG